MNLTPQQIEKLEEKGWTILCESPLEMQFIHPDYKQDGVSGTATGMIAKDVLKEQLAIIEKEEKAAVKKASTKNIQTKLQSQWPWPAVEPTSDSSLSKTGKKTKYKNK